MTRRLTPAFGALGYAIMEKEQRPDAAAWGAPGEVYDLTDVWTITDGHWMPGETDKPIDIPDWASNDYREWWAMQGRYHYGPIGSATSLFALVLNPDGTPREGKQMWFFTRPDRLTPPYSGLENWAKQNTGPQGMTHIEIGGHESGYAPGSHGAWAICPMGLSDVLCYTGRYDGWHISTMAVWKARAPQPPVTPPVEPPANETMLALVQAIKAQAAANGAALSAIQADVRALAAHLGKTL